jgi:hypothetical protein
MTTSRNRIVAILKEGTGYLAARPGQALGIACLAMALGALAPLLQVKAGLPDDLDVGMALGFASILPLELYFVPRFLIAADAMAGGSPLNTAEEWSRHFEERWLRAFGAKILLMLVVLVGFLAVLVPGLLVLLFFGWTPLRVLVRGESLAQAARGSARLMARAWLPVLATALTLAAVYLCCYFAVDALAQTLLPDPSAWQRLTHPIMWLANFLVGLLNLWLSAGLLALYRSVENA